MEDNGAILVAGTGPAGLIAALAFAEAGHEVSIVGPAENREDARTTALMMPAMAFLDRLGVAEGFSNDAAPLKVMRIVDATSRLVRGPPATFRANEIGEEAFGSNVPNSALVRSLKEAIRANSAIAWHDSFVTAWHPGGDAIEATLDDGSSITARLAVAADGRRSPAREAAGIRAHARAYPQTAIVLNFAHTRDHGFASTEFHTEAGPCTQVPLPGRRSSLVWAVAPETAAELMQLDDAALSARVESRLQSFLGAVTVEPGRQSYPLSAAAPTRFARHRIALIGEAAHVFPPIGAQGLNLGIRDIQDLVKVVDRYRGDPGSDAALTAYDLKRRPDILARSSAVGLLNRSLLSALLPAQLARGAGLGLIGGFAPARAFFMREGMRPGSGFKSLFERRYRHEAS